MVEKVLRQRLGELVGTVGRLVKLQCALLRKESLYLGRGLNVWTVAMKEYMEERKE